MARNLQDPANVLEIDSQSLPVFEHVNLDWARVPVVPRAADDLSEAAEDLELLLVQVGVRVQLGLRLLQLFRRLVQLLLHPLQLLLEPHVLGLEGLRPGLTLEGSQLVAPVRAVGGVHQLGLGIRQYVLRAVGHSVFFLHLRSSLQLRVRTELQVHAVLRLPGSVLCELAPRDDRPHAEILLLFVEVAERARRHDGHAGVLVVQDRVARGGVHPALGDDPVLLAVHAIRLSAFLEHRIQGCARPRS
mmetsp:Transcript_97998/g.277411  ORF Transcript_97998/g.277411 Transcript_97998/m.277411 type:complete len:246 (+) Transcript_97998:1471-2208(+)